LFFPWTDPQLKKKNKSGRVACPRSFFSLDRSSAEEKEQVRKGGLPRSFFSLDRSSAEEKEQVRKGGLLPLFLLPGQILG